MPFPRILFLADAVAADRRGGAQTVAWELARRLGSYGYRPVFLVPRHHEESPGHETLDGIEIQRYAGAGRPLAFLRGGSQAARQLEPIQLCHSHFAYAALGPGWAIPRAVPRVRTFHGAWHEEGLIEEQGYSLFRHLKYRLRRWIERRDLRRSRRIVVLSEFSRGEVLALGLGEEKIQLVPGGADGDRFPPALDRAVARAQIGAPAHGRLLFTVRRHAARMGLDNLVDAMPAVLARFPDTFLLIGGDGPEAARLEHRISAQGLQNHIRRVGSIPEHELSAYYQAADLFVLPTIALEGFGLVTVEALSSGTPVLGTPVGATPEILRSLDPRLLTAGSAPSDLASGIIRFFAEDVGAGLPPQRLHDFVRARYTWEKHAAGMAEIYRELLLTP